MAWGRVDDGHYDHPKVLSIPRAIRNACDGLYWRLISRCNRTLSDGWITDGDRELCDAESEHVEALVTAGLLDRTPAGRLRVHDFLVFNKSRREALADSQKKADAGRAGGLASGRARAKKQAQQKRALREAAGSNGVEAKSKPVPTRPDPSRPNGATSNQGVPPLRGSVGRRATEPAGNAR